jgi:hypothetical protein
MFAPCITKNTRDMKKLQIEITDKHGNKEPYTIPVIGDSDKFSAKALRKGLQAAIVKLVTGPWGHTINRGSRLTIRAAYDGLTVDLRPIYFGGYKPGENADKQLKEQLAALVLDVKELVG